MICWYCHWGWARPVAEIYLEALRRLDGDESPLHYGPSHIVWEDENFDCAEICLEDFDKSPLRDDYSSEELAVVRWSLEELAKIPADDREAAPDEYDGIHPELFPPKVEVIKI